MAMDCRYAIATAGLLSLHLCRLFQARLTPAARSQSSLVTQSCFNSFANGWWCVAQRLFAVIADHKSGVQFLDSPRRREAARGRGAVFLRREEMFTMGSQF